ncbi:glycosyltransferase [[Clostridium] polysaccharolyticum]|nr:hypothetical protein [[Clostridium] polysaccharolyticum]
MKKILFVSFPATGHVNASKKFIKELCQRQDSEVYYVTLREHFRRFDDVKGLHLIPYNEEYVQYYRTEEKHSGKIKSNLLQLLYMLYQMMEKSVEFIDHTVERIKPDRIVCDPFAIGAKAVAKKYKIPYHLYFSFLVQNPAGDAMPPGIKKMILLHPVTLFKAMRLQKKLTKKYGYCDMPWDLLDHQHVKTIVTTSSKYHPYGDRYPENVFFAGPPDVWKTEPKPKKDMVFVSLGTVESNVCVIKACLELAKTKKCEFVITLAGNKQNYIQKEDSLTNVTIYENLTPEEFRGVLSEAKVFINSGGINSVSDSIMAMTPVLVYSASQESHDMGVLVQEYHCGYLHEGKIKVKELEREIDLLLQDKSYSSGLPIYRESFWNAAGYEKAAEFVLRES